MDELSIEAAYSPFVDALRAGGFAAPADGWPAELVAAHVCHNNELIAEMAERIIGGDHPSYDNAPAVDDDALRAYAEDHGGLPGLADAIEASAKRLAAAWGALDEGNAGYQLPVVIHDSGVVVRETPIEIRAFIEGNASFHLDAHLQQLLDLRP
jgi:hypothetical protein